MTMDRIKKICLEFFAGDTDERRAAEIQEFLSESPSNRALYETWENEWYAREVPSFSQVNSFARIKADIRSRKVVRAWRWAAVAACAAIVVISTVLLVPGRKPSQKVEEMLCIVETGCREKTKVVLPDSTQVWLNAFSRISYNKDFLSGDRIVSLEGEAYFDVKKLPGRKFTVNLDGSHVNVLGTKFNVSAYRGEHLCEVALLEGSVEFTTPGTHVEMIPGEILRMDTAKGEMEKIKGNASKDISWMDNKLDYDRITLDRLLRRLSSLYGVQIDYTPGKNPGATFGVILNLEESLSGILDGLTLIRPVKWTVSPDGTYCVTEY